jgi:CubicO group peptidase (beta-lactamase class C family)
VFFLIPGIHSGKAQGLYFPPLNPSSAWDTLSPESLGWCTEKIAPLYDFLEQENTKGFVVLKDGKIVLEKYFGTFTNDSLWYWASAGKTLTAFLAGRAQEDGNLSIYDRSSKFQGNGWTNCTPEQEDKITIRHQLTMTTGLDDGVPDNHCTLDTCLNYLAEAGSRWAYHNAPYTLLEKVLVNATGQSVNTFTQQKLKAQTGMTGLWYTVDYDNVFFSNVRSMARFGLLIQNKGAWSKDTLLHDTAYLHQMMNTSQSLNNSYGYLWWLNGKSSFMLPGVQIVFPGSWAPHAPADMVAGLGKNGQIVSISPSKSLVMVRMGNPPGSSGSEIPSQLCDQIWEKLNEVICVAGSVEDEYPVSASLKVYPNPASQSFTVELSQQHFSIAITDLAGRLICERKSVFDKIEINSQNFLDGTFFIRVINEKKVFNQRLVILQRQP